MAIKYAIAPSGTVVNKATGNAIRGNITTKVYKNGQVGIYRNGRQIGRASKPTLAQQQIINKKDVKRVKRREYEKRRKVEYLEPARVSTIEEIIEDLGDVRELYTGQADYQDMINRYNDYWKNDKDYHIKHGDLARHIDIQKMNFAKALEHSVKSGIMTQDQANTQWDRFINATTDKERSFVWNDLNDLYEERGYRYTRYD